MNFLQGHYNQYRQAGGDHASYVVVNDLSDETAAQLKAEYEHAHPEPVPEAKQREFREQLSREARDAEARDDLEWLTGTGRYGQ